MSVSRNQSRVAPYYDFKMYNVSLTGLESNRTRAAAASPTVSLAFGQVVLNASTSVANGLWKSTNNINWSQITTAPNTAIYSVAYGNNTFVGVGAAGVIFTSPGTDGETWTARTKAGSSANNFNKVTFVNGLFFAQQQSDNMQYSSDGVTWNLVGGAAASIPNFVAADSLGQWRPSLIYSKGTYIWFTGATASTASDRAYWINQGDLVTTSGVNWSNNAINSGYAFTNGRPDPGDGMGPFCQVMTGSTYLPETRFVRINTTNVSGSFQTGSFIGSIETPNFGGGIDAPVLATPLASTYNANLWQGLYYNEGWYTSVFPALTARTRFGGTTASDIYSIGVSKWSENEFYPGITGQDFSDKRVSIFPQYLVSSNVIEGPFRNVAEWDQGQKKIIMLAGDQLFPNKSGIIVLVGSKAIRPLRTTVNERAG
jgi:hypothetical protein